MLSKNTRVISVLALLSATTVAPVSAQTVGCDLNGIAAGPAFGLGADSLSCGTVQSSSGPVDDVTFVGVDVTFAASQLTLIGAHAIGVDNDTAVVSYVRPFEPAGSVVVGAYAIAAGEGNVAIGEQALVGVFTFEAGTVSIDEAVTGSTAVGSWSDARTSSSSALGYAATAEFGTAIGAQAIAIGGISGNNFAVAVGNSATADNLGAVSIGAASNFFDGAGEYAVGIGASSTSSGDRSIAIGGAGSGGGAATEATAADSIAIGSGAKSTHANSIALGAGTDTTAANQVHVGGRTISGVTAGVAATDAVNVSQLTAATTGITADITALEAAQLSLSSDVDTLFDMRKEDRRDMKQGVAAAMSMASAPMPSTPGGISYALNGATFRGEYAVGGSLQYRLETQSPMAVNVGFSLAGNKNNGFRLGVAGEF